MRKCVARTLIYPASGRTRMSSTSHLMDAEYWLGRAEEARAQANQTRDPDAKRTLLEIADNYQQLAEQAEARRKSGMSKTT